MILFIVISGLLSASSREALAGQSVSEDELLKAFHAISSHDLMDYVVELTSKDVIHSFFLPEFRVKQDAVPGMKTRIWFEGNKVGHWEIACAELCGLGHYRMKGFVTVDTAEDYQKWLAEQAAEQQAVAAPDKGGNS